MLPMFFKISIILVSTIIKKNYEHFLSSTNGFQIDKFLLSSFLT